MYWSEFWGIYDIPEIEKLHYKFCKYLLGVKPSTCNYAVLVELVIHLLHFVNNVHFSII